MSDNPSDLGNFINGRLEFETVEDGDEDSGEEEDPGIHEHLLLFLYKGKGGSNTDKISKKNVEGTLLHPRKFERARFTRVRLLIYLEKM